MGMATRAVSRRGLLLCAGAAALLAGCANGVGAGGAARLDAEVDRTLNFLATSHPDARGLQERSVGQLVMPLMTEGGLLVGGSYGRGALRVGRATVDYYSATQASLGLQAGGQTYAHVLYFMNEPALRAFRTSSGWVAGAEVEYAYLTSGASLGADTVVVNLPVVAVVFGQSGLLAGASVEGTKYTRIIP